MILQTELEHYNFLNECIKFIVPLYKSTGKSWTTPVAICFPQIGAGLPVILDADIKPTNREQRVLQTLLTVYGEVAKKIYNTNNYSYQCADVNLYDIFFSISDKQMQEISTKESISNPGMRQSIINFFQPPLPSPAESAVEQFIKKYRSIIASTRVKSARSSTVDSVEDNSSTQAPKS